MSSPSKVTDVQNPFGLKCFVFNIFSSQGKVLDSLACFYNMLFLTLFILLKSIKFTYFVITSLLFSFCLGFSLQLYLLQVINVIRFL